MKKIISLLLVLAMVLSIGVTSVLAADIGGNWESGTVVTYNADATATEYYTVTVPAALNPGDSGTVTAEGNFPSNKTLKVTADTSVGLTDGISTKTLGVSFAGIELAGSNTAAVSTSSSVTVANWNDEVKAPLFGEWKGTFNYFVEIVVPTVMFTDVEYLDSAGANGVTFDSDGGFNWIPMGIKLSYSTIGQDVFMLWNGENNQIGTFSSDGYTFTKMDGTVYTYTP